ncbi:MAG TPA: hypothetical protein VG759_19245 [Candidatus Angelobacter sp.]|jgi:hypothetical protein|nr:hypothetical protein [Candidatus Angelobacter sp.]
MLAAPFREGEERQQWSDVTLEELFEEGSSSCRSTTLKKNVSSARQNLALREGLTKGSSSKIKEEQTAGFHVIYADFDSVLTPEQLNGPNLAAYAIASVEQCVRSGHAFNNGVRYLLENIEWGIATPLTAQYTNAILQGTQCNTLTDAEHKLLTQANWSPQNTTGAH